MWKESRLSGELGGVWEAQGAFCESVSQQTLDHCLLAIAGHGQFADQQIAAALQHFLFAEGYSLRLIQNQKALQHRRNFEQRTGAHTVGIDPETVLPIFVVVAIARSKKFHNLIDFLVLYDRAHADRVHIVKWHHHLEAAGLNGEQVKLLDVLPNGATANLLYNSNAMVGVNDFIADTETAVTTQHEENRLTSSELKNKHF